jgi:A/G-specific adenine glycosylase
MKNIHKSLKQWYETNGRKDLPWRKTTNPYHIYLSEIMLQQTTVKTVLERFYFPFLEKFPTLQSVSTAPLEEVLKMWEGLGYYRRARSLPEASIACKGVLPSTQEGLLSLKGIGKTTSHAIMVFAFGASLPILDGNVKRVLCRFFALGDASEKELWDKAYELVDTRNPYLYNQAMMDIGSQVCTLASPKCENCPLASGCLGASEPLSYKPFKRKQSQPTVYQKMIIPTTHDNFFLFTKREGEFLHGLWGFDQIPEDQQEWHFDGVTYDVALMAYQGRVRHVYTHFIVEADVYTLLLPHNQQMIRGEDIPKLPLSKIDHKALSLLQ